MATIVNDVLAAEPPALERDAPSCRVARVGCGAAPGRGRGHRRASRPTRSARPDSRSCERCQLGLSREISVAPGTETSDREVPVDVHTPHVVGDSASEWFDASYIFTPLPDQHSSTARGCRCFSVSVTASDPKRLFPLLAPGRNLDSPNDFLQPGYKRRAGMAQARPYTVRPPVEAGSARSLHGTSHPRRTPNRSLASSPRCAGGCWQGTARPSLQ
jgi:hypothetical protein